MMVRICAGLAQTRTMKKRDRLGENITRGVCSMDWDQYFMGFALHAAKKSKDPTKVGAVLVGPQKETRLPAYNGPPHGVLDLPERRERPLKYLFSSHAETNLVAFAAREGIRTDGCTVYVTHACCAACARTLIQAGIKKIVYGAGTTSMPAEEFEAAAKMFEEAGVKTYRMTKDETDFLD
jgi:dCMP deaminase